MPRRLQSRRLRPSGLADRPLKIGPHLGNLLFERLPDEILHHLPSGTKLSFAFPIGNCSDVLRRYCVWFTTYVENGVRVHVVAARQNIRYLASGRPCSSTKKF
jgi:hypothetical protein